MLKAISGNTANSSGGSSGDMSGDGATTSNSSGVSRNAKGTTRGERNNNPGNLNFVGQRGARLESGSGSRFAYFDSEISGMKALYNQLQRYYTGKTTGKKLQTIRDIISTWAPANENNTRAYIANVSKKLGIGENQKLNLNDVRTTAELMKAIVTMENGRNRYSDEIYMKAILGNQYRSPTSSQPRSTSSNVTHIQHVTVNSHATSTGQLTRDMQQQARLTTANAFITGSD